MDFFYLSNRSSVVSINNSHSTSPSFPFGVSQGSVLGFLFILYNSELPKVIPLFSFQSAFHADDSYIFTSFPDLSFTMSKFIFSLIK